MLRSMRVFGLKRVGTTLQNTLQPIEQCQSGSAALLNYCTFKSSISLGNLYPNSSLNLAKTPTIPKAEDEEKKFSGFIPMDQLKITYSRSSGPGGMNVNCVSTKVDIRFHVDTASWIPQLIRNNMKTKLRASISRDGFLIVTSDRTRSQHLNTADALEKLRTQIRSCEPIEDPEPSPETVEKLRRVREKATRERLRLKRSRSITKEARGPSSI